MAQKLYLSQLAPDTLLSYEDAHYTITAEELRERIKEDSDFINLDWYIATGQKWAPDAKDMLADYIENQYQNMYEDWDEKALDCLQDVHYRRIQDILDDAFHDRSVTDYWILGNDQVIIDH